MEKEEEVERLRLLERVLLREDGFGPMWWE